MCISLYISPQKLENGSPRVKVQKFMAEHTFRFMRNNQKRNWLYHDTQNWVLFQLLHNIFTACPRNIFHLDAFHIWFIGQGVVQIFCKCFTVCLHIFCNQYVSDIQNWTCEIRMEIKKPFVVLDNIVTIFKSKFLLQNIRLMPGQPKRLISKKKIVSCLELL